MMGKYAILYTNDYGEILLKFTTLGKLIGVCGEDEDFLKKNGISDIDEFLNSEEAPLFWNEYSTHWEE